jgi:AraC family transcriptional regulator of adaptative response / DNA-3-methyladenine glycosylase II
MELPVKEVCYRALQSRDARFDGLIYVGVKSTGIYCRPVCPARTAKYENCSFFSSAAAAQQAGFRPCLRCRPETAPNLASWRGTSNTVTRAVALIDEGALDGDHTNVEALASRLGIGERQLRRLFRQHLGASPIAVAQTRRILFARQLINETQMPMTEIALAAGFGSLRRFNEVFQKLFDRPPSALRRRAGGLSSNPAAGVTLRLRYCPPYDWASMLAYLEARAIPGVEAVSDGVYRRTIEIKDCSGTVEVSHLPQWESLAVSIHFPNVQCLPEIVNRLRRMFDLDADIGTIGAHLRADKLLAPLVAARPGLRAPGAWDPFELAIRAVLGQQISVAAARRFAGQLVALHGKSISDTGNSSLSHLFPIPERLAKAESLGLKMPGARLATLQAVAQAASSDPSLFRLSGTIDDAISRLRNIRGIGEWTAQYIAMRALREADAFPATDIGLLRSVAKLAGRRVGISELIQRAEGWRPWRAYAAQHLWAADSITAVAGDSNEQKTRVVRGSCGDRNRRNDSRSRPGRELARH